MTDRTTTSTHGLDDETLRARVAATDPTAGTDAPAPDVHLLVEDVLARDRTTPAPSRGRRVALLVGGLVAAAAVAAVVAGLGGSPRGEVLTVQAAPAGGLTMTSCLPVDAQTLSGFPVAFAGTVAETSGTTATLDVDRWFAGGDAERVQVEGLDPELVVSGYSVQLTAGQNYLVAVGEDGTVASCGFTGPADPALQAVYDEAFGG